MRIGIAVSPQGSTTVRAMQDHARHAEEVGFDAFTSGDSQSIFREVYCTLTACALVTERVTLGTSVTNPSTRHPVVAASALATIDETSGGRAMLGIGAGQSATGTLGLAPAKIADLEATIVAIRTALDPALHSQATRGRVEWSRRAVPIVVHAAGPAGLGVAVREGDGVMLRLGDLDEAGLAARIRELRAARAERPIDVWLYAPTGIAPSRAEAAAMVAPVVSARTLTTKVETIPSELQDAHRRFAARYDYAHHASLQNPVNFELLTELGLVDYMIDRLASVGTTADVAGWMDRMQAIGVDTLLLGGSVPDLHSFMDDVGRIIASRAEVRSGDVTRS